MAGQNGKNLGSWFGDITNLAALLVIAVVVFELIRPRSTLILLLAVGALLVLVILRYADVGRFREAVSSQEGIPPLGLAHGSVRAFLAFGILVGVGVYIYYAATTGQFKSEIFTALTSIVSAVVGFYFGAKTAAGARPAVKPSAPTVSGIEPKTGKAGSKVRITNLAGTGFQADTTVRLVKEQESLLAEEVHVANSTRITCIFNVPTATKPGNWDVVVTNPDGQTGTLPDGFKIESA